MMILAAELVSSHCRLIAVRRGKHAPAEVVATAAIQLEDADAVDQLRAFRRAHKLPPRLRVVLWPHAEDPGVSMVTQRPRESVVPASSIVVRERVRPLVRAGFRVAAVSLPHEVLAYLASLMDASFAVLLGLHADLGCLTFARSGRAGHVPAYLSWPQAALPAGASAGAAAAENGRLLSRYQFAARLAPHVQHLLRRAPDGTRVFACGALADLRAAVVPLIEETDVEVEVMDDGLAGQSNLGPSADVAGLQIAWATALLDVSARGPGAAAGTRSASSASKSSLLR